MLHVLAEAASPADFMAARTQMALTLGLHIILACIGIGLPGLTLIAEWRAVRTGDPDYRRLARIWAKATAVLFAVGAVSGTVLSFEMGTLWPGLMGKFGQVIGLPFAIEGIAFFIEAIFLGIYLYGWDRLPPRQHLLTGIPVVLGGLTSAFSVVTVNAWMQQPRGFHIVNGEVVDVQPLAAMFNPATPHQTVHMILAALMVCSFLVAGVYALAWLRGRRDRYHRLGFAIPFSLGSIAAPIQVVVGDWAVRAVADNQPVKLAAMESLEHTQAGAPFTIGVWEVPNLLSLMLHFDTDAVVPGLDRVRPGLRPPTEVVHWSFDVMVGCGVALLGLAAWFGMVAWRRRRLPRSAWFWRAASVAGLLAVVAMEAGWITTEVGRQPWIVYGVMRTEEAVNPDPGLVVGLYVVIVVYAVLGAVTISVLRRMSRSARAEREAERESERPEVTAGSQP